MGLGTGAIAGIVGGIGAAGSIGSALIGSNASKSAANKISNADQQAIGTIQSNNAPFNQAGAISITQLLAGLQNGTFGPGSIAPFSAPTAQQAENTPGFQFQEQQGDKGILQAQAASGGAFNVGTTKALDSYNQGLASTSYGNTFSQALQTYNAQLTGQQQAFNQLFQPAQLGAQTTQNTNTSISQLLQNMGGAQAAGTVGSANALTSGLSGLTNTLGQTAALTSLGSFGGGNPTPSNVDWQSQLPGTVGKTYQPGIGPG